MAHKHAKLIKKWADGAVIQYQKKDSGEWDDCLCNHPHWDVGTAYRVKPDLVRVYATAITCGISTPTPARHMYHNLLLVFDDAGKLKSAEVIA